ncbi:cobalt ECF transporter T component CbiQ [Deferrisoma camini]|uniref:cobalt ECF transporter T component CbiQ n=1 Tax=Deferrisoma camini TaxID=1035120 RepID=UPI00046D667C|nr:cobalt ECF transporter T component CbiQ [Deferrisoma camini]
MAGVERAFLDLGRLDRLAYADTPVHRLDPRAKIVATLVYLVAVVSHGKYEVSGLLPYALFPAVLIAQADLPLGYLIRKLLVVAPFAVLVGAANPWLDRTPMLSVGPVTVTGGWMSYASILVRFVLTIGAALVLVATTGFYGVCLGLRRLGTPRVMAVQLLLLYRYLFVLADEALRLVRARGLRSFGRRGTGLGVYGSLVGHLLLRTLDRARRIHTAMLCRGFSGEFRTLRTLRFRGADWAFLLGWSALFVMFRLVNVPRLVGALFV